MSETYNPWEEQDLLNKAVEQGAVFKHPRTGWKFKVRHVTGWSPHLARATTLAFSKPEVADVLKKRGEGAKLTPVEEATLERANLDIGIRATLIQWSGVTDRAGKPLPITHANAVLLFGHMRSIWTDLQAFAANPASFGLQTLPEGTVPEGVDVVGNSPATSDTPLEASPAS